MTDQTCRTCQKVKPIDQFHLSRHKTPETLCKACKQVAQTEKRRANRDEYNAKQREKYAAGVRYGRQSPDEINARRRAKRASGQSSAYSPEKRRKWMLKSKYGLSVEQFEEMWDRQDGKCPSCGDALVLGTKNGAHVDHCHSTGRVRGVLCGLCNVALGYLKDDPKRIMGLHGYMLEFAND